MSQLNCTILMRAFLFPSVHWCRLLSSPLWTYALHLLFSLILQYWALLHLHFVALTGTMIVSLHLPLLLILSIHHSISIVFPLSAPSTDNYYRPCEDKLVFKQLSKQGLGLLTVTLEQLSSGTVEEKILVWQGKFICQFKALVCSAIREILHIHGFLKSPVMRGMNRLNPYGYTFRLTNHMQTAN